MLNPKMQQMLQAMKMAKDPMGYLKQRCANNPMFQRAMQITQGKNDMQVMQAVQNMSKNIGMNDAQLQEFLSELRTYL